VKARSVTDPRGATAPVRRPKGRKDAIALAAAELVADRGYGGVSVADIAAQVGITAPAIYRHYAGKDGVLAAVLERTAAGVAEAAETADGAGVEPLLRAAVGYVLDHPALVAAYLRERGRVAVPAEGPLGEAEVRFLDAWRRAAHHDGLRLGAERLLVRRAAALAAVVAGARFHRGVERPRLDDLLVASATAIATTEPDLPERGPSDAGWHPPTGKREALLVAALARFRVRGFSGVGMDEIGEAAGLSGPTIYHYFDSKSDLLLEAYDRAGERVAAGSLEAVEGATTATQALDRLLDSYCRTVADQLDLLVVASRDGWGLPDRDRPRLARRRRLIRDTWCGVVRELRPELTEAEVRLLVRMAFALVIGGVEALDGQPARQPEVVALARAHLFA
jgi:AcrR family transcriptional regulator